jgi:hypothetical protein
MTNGESMKKPLWIIFTITRLVAACFLVWALAKHPYSYFESLRLGVIAVCVFGAYCAWAWKQIGWVWAFGFIAILFNPFVKIALNRQTWNVVDVIVAAFLVLTIFLLKDNKRAQVGI